MGKKDSEVASEVARAPNEGNLIERTRRWAFVFDGESRSLLLEIAGEVERLWQGEIDLKARNDRWQMEVERLNEVINEKEKEIEEAKNAVDHEALRAMNLSGYVQGVRDHAGIINRLLLAIQFAGTTKGGDL